MGWLFWSMAGLCVYAYAGYPVLLWMWTRGRHQPWDDSAARRQILAGKVCHRFDDAFFVTEFGYQFADYYIHFFTELDLLGIGVQEFNSVCYSILPGNLFCHP